MDTCIHQQSFEECFTISNKERVTGSECYCSFEDLDEAVAELKSMFEPLFL